MRPTFDVVVANYNNGKYLESLIDSILCQSCDNWHLIIVDDHSNDNSKQILQKYERHPQISAHFNTSNMGVCATFHRGIVAGSSPFVGLLGADDALPRHAIESMLHCFTEQPGASMIYSQATACDEKLTPLHTWPNTQPLNHTEHISNQLHKIFNFISFTRKAYENSGGLDISLRKAMDHDLTLKLFEQGDIIHLPQPLYYYRCHDKGISQGQSGLLAAQYSLLAQIRSCNRPTKFPLSKTELKKKLHLYHTRSAHIGISCENKRLFDHVLNSFLYISSLRDLRTSMATVKKLIAQ